MTIKYFNLRLADGTIETVDQVRYCDFAHFPISKRWKEFNKEKWHMLSSYHENGCAVSISNRSTKQWRDEGGGL